jgi:ADP-ribose pyrophosphatase
MSETKKEQPKILCSATVFTGRVFTVTADTVQEGDVTYTREVVRHPGSAVIIPFFDDGTVALVRQFGTCLRPQPEH